jgi:phosphoribosylamine--glycine ligase
MSRARRILVVGSGGREHALAWRLSRDDDAGEVLVSPGNDGMRARHRCLAVAENDAAGLLEACRRERIDLVVVGPEEPLAAGLADSLRDAGVAVYGPGAEGARLESSKWFAKERMREAGVPTARAETFTTLAAAREALSRFGPPWVVKADGLAAGKGVCVTADAATAAAFLDGCFSGRFGVGARVLLEEHLDGEELSVMAVCDGTDAVLLTAARDYKRALEGDHGANTGGMGALAQGTLLDEAGERRVLDAIVRPILGVMAARGAPYRGTLYVGLMVTARGPHVIEFNCRFGDPETQVILPLTGGSLVALLDGAARGAADAGAVSRIPGAAVAVALVDAGYPDAVRGGGVIAGLDDIESGARRVFHARTRREGTRWIVSGGRAAYVCATGADTTAARQHVYDGIARLGGDGWRYRSDIAAAGTVAAQGRGGV